MGNATFIGRVGTLAVMLGVGVAIANSPVVALADQTGSSSSSSSGDSTSAASTSTGSSSNSPAASASSASSSTEASTNSSTQSSSTDPPAGVVQASGGANSTVNGTGTPSTTGTGKRKTRTTTTTAAQTSASSSAQMRSTRRRGSSEDGSPASGATSPTVSVSAANTTAPAAGRASLPRLVAAASLPTNASPTITAGSTSAVSTISFRAKTAAVVTQAAPAAVSAPAPVRGIVRTIITGLLSAIDFAPQAANGPVAPAQSPALWTLMAWARREIGQTRGPGIAPAGMQQLNALTVPAAAVIQSPNLLVNPGAELGDPSLSGYSMVSVPGWTETGTPTVIKYGTLRRLPWPTGSPGPTLPAFLGFPSLSNEPPGGGQQFFGGGPVATSILTQIVDLSGAMNAIDQGGVAYDLSGDLGGFTIDPSRASVTVDFLDANGVKLGTGALRPVTALNRGFRTGFIERDTAGTIPVGTRAAQVVVTFKDFNPVLGNYNNAYADDLSFTVGASLPAPPPPQPPASTVGQLDHVFMVYMENKGFTDIVGSPNAPYLNSLINTYGFGTNYFALTHPSDPNYYPILGGSDFGTNFNCPSNCFDEPNLADLIDASPNNLSWAGYMDGGGGYSTPTDRLPFLAFSDIYNDPARVNAHLFDLSQMGPDLASTATAPNFVWFAADDATNMEGPTNTVAGIIRWTLSQLTNHQYNVAAGDQFLQQEVPVIMNSAVWNDTSQKSAIFITFDEDYNNLSLGIGNQGNHIPMIVIPSPGAVLNGGMVPGHFEVDDYNNHYSLQRTIEDALGLSPLTNNDRFAEPMNGYWVPPVPIP